MSLEQKEKKAILLVHCPDQKGIVAGITRFLHENGGNIIYLDQHVDTSEGAFFMRIEWELENFLIPEKKISDYIETLLVPKYRLSWKLFFSQDVPRMAIFVSRLSHCLYDILSRWQDGEWNVEIPLIISNHEDLAEAAGRFRIPFHHLQVSPESKMLAEKEQKALLEKHKVDLVVLARYMQILSPELITGWDGRIINIHHSFLPAFPGAKPYHSAMKRGVKIIGATSHYVTGELDAGPIIEQDVVRISHKDSVHDVIRKGQDLEKIVLARAVYAHLQHKLLVFNNRTIVFS